MIDYKENTFVMDEIGRLREMTFRSIGEGTGRSKDIDRYDHYYRHLVLWDDEKLEIAGAYRLGEIWRWQNQPIGELYSSTLFSYQAAQFVKGGLSSAAVLCSRNIGACAALITCGRALVPIWPRINKYNTYLVPFHLKFPKSARDMVYFYTIHFPDLDRLAIATHPYEIDPATKAYLQKKMPGQELALSLRMGLKIPKTICRCLYGGVKC